MRYGDAERGMPNMDPAAKAAALLAEVAPVFTGVAKPSVADVNCPLLSSDSNKNSRTARLPKSLPVTRPRPAWTAAHDAEMEYWPICALVSP